MNTFPSSKKPLQKAYMLVVMRRIIEKMHHDGDRWATAHSVPWPVRMNSTVSTIAQNGPLTGREIAKSIGYSPQLIAQYLKFLRNTDVVQSIPGLKDKRSKLESLTQNGEKHYRTLKTLEDAADSVYGEIFDDIGVNLHTLLLKFETQLDEASLAERLDRFFANRELAD